jgi:hypothetical protein
VVNIIFTTDVLQTARMLQIFADFQKALAFMKKSAIERGVLTSH